MRLRVAALVMGVVGVALAGVAAWPLASSGAGSREAGARDVAEAPATAQAADILPAESKLAADARQIGLYRSEVAGIVIVPADQIPANNHPASREPCHENEFPSPEARLVAGKGWTVTDEKKAGAYHLVAFVGQTQAGMSNICLRGNGGIALFRDGGLRALVQESRGLTDLPPSESFPAARLAFLRAPDQGGLRIFDGNVTGGAPVADMHFDANGTVRIAAQAAVDTVCADRAQVPNIDDMSIYQARYGWVPAITRFEDQMERESAEAIAGPGLPEVESCSGTGVGYCGFAYQGKAGILKVTTVGDADEPYVVGYSTDCK